MSKTSKRDGGMDHQHKLPSLLALNPFCSQVRDPQSLLFEDIRRMRILKICFGGIIKLDLAAVQIKDRKKKNHPSSTIPIEPRYLD